MMTSVVVCPLSALDKSIRQHGARAMIAFGGPEAKLDQPKQIDRTYLALRFNDINEPRPGLIGPTIDHVAQIISFAHSWDQESPILLQCWMGISRSTAAAAIILAGLKPTVPAAKIAHSIRQASPSATPNPLMIKHADALLNRAGSLNNAIADIGRGENASEGTQFSISLNSLK